MTQPPLQKMDQITWQQAICIRTRTSGNVRDLRAGCSRRRKTVVEMSLKELLLPGSKEIVRSQGKCVRWMSNKDVGAEVSSCCVR